jgi:hypothetical protein
VFLQVALLATTNQEGELSLLVKIETQHNTHEGKGISGMLFETCDDQLLDFVGYAKKRMSEIYPSTGELELLTNSPVAYYTDPWKSNQRVKTVVLRSKEQVKLDSLPKGKDVLSYHAISLKSGVTDLIELAKKEELAIDCDMYQLLYGLNIGFCLQSRV